MTAKHYGFVLDCSVTMAWCFEDEINEYSEQVFDALNTASAAVPTIWPLEVANVLLVAERRKRLSVTKSAHFKEALAALPIHIDESTSEKAMNSILDLARATSLTIYDAAYLELAMRYDLPIATLDNDLKKIAHKTGIRLYKPQ